jgi:hypothetical protein
MAISEDRLSISEITKGEVSDFQKTIDSSINTINGTINGISNSIDNTIDSVMAGFESKVSDVLDPIQKIELPFSSESSGILDNLLCLKIPDVDFRLPKFKLDIFKDWDFDLNMKICGESKRINPVDAALSVVDKFKNPESFVNNLKKDIIDKLVNDNVDKILGNFGANDLIDCLMGDSLSGVIDSNNTLGNSLSDKMSLKNILNMKGCAGDYIRNQANVYGLNNITTKTVIEKITATKDPIISNQIMSEIRSSDPVSTSRAASTMMVSSENISAVYTKTDTLQSSYYSGVSIEHKNNKLENILNNTSHDVSDNVTVLEKINLQTNSANMFKSIANEEIYTEDKVETFNNIILTADLIDKNWNKDEYGNVNLYKLKNNKNMNTLTEEYIKNIPVKNTNLLTGIYTTSINVPEMILVNNLEFKEEVLT